MTAFAEGAAKDAIHLSNAEVLGQVELFFRSRGVDNVLHARVEGITDPIDLTRMRDRLKRIINDTSSPRVLRIEVLMMMLLENGGRMRVDEIAERGRCRAEKKAGPSKAG
jgi:hypothetical protein